MNVTAHITSQKVIDHYTHLPDKLDLAVKLAVEDVSKLAIREIVGKEGLTKYPRHAKGTPTPSPVGEPPAQVSTNLRKSVRSEPIKRVGFGHYSQVTLPHMVYARIQELGGEITTKNGKVFVIPARPYVAPARERIRKSGQATRIFTRRVLKEVKHG